MVTTDSEVAATQPFGTSMPRSGFAGVVTRVFARIAGAPLDDRFRIEEQKSAAAIASAVRDPKLPTSRSPCARTIL
jgi:hypothetical protein